MRKVLKRALVCMLAATLVSSVLFGDLSTSKLYAEDLIEATEAAIDEATEEIVGIDSIALPEISDEAEAEEELEAVVADAEEVAEATDEEVQVEAVVEAVEEAEATEDSEVEAVVEEAEEVEGTEEVDEVEVEEVEAEEVEAVEYPQATFAQVVGNTVVSVNAPAGAFPAGTECSVYRVVSTNIADEVGSEEYVAYDITFYYEGVEVQPLVPVAVTFNNVQLDAEEVSVYHMENVNAGADLIAADVVNTGSTTIKAESFSIYIIVQFPDDENGYLLDLPVFQTPVNIYNATTDKNAEDALDIRNVKFLPVAPQSGTYEAAFVSSGEYEWDVWQPAYYEITDGEDSVIYDYEGEKYGFDKLLFKPVAEDKYYDVLGFELMVNKTETMKYINIRSILTETPVGYASPNAGVSNADENPDVGQYYWVKLPSFKTTYHNGEEALASTNHIKNENNEEKNINFFPVSTEEPTREGYTFLGWSTVKDDKDNIISDDFFTTPAYEDFNLYAVWEEENPTPVDPTPVDPTPVDPTPVDPTPVDPTPVDPTPVDPTPVDPTPVDPTPVDPTPVDPTPVNPTPVDPTPVNPTPVAPVPENIAIVVPEPEVVVPEVIEIEEEVTPEAPVVEPEAEVTPAAEPEVAVIPESQTPAADSVNIPDEKAPLASHGKGKCWVHWLILFITLCDAVYATIRGIHNSRKKNEKDNKKNA